MPPRKRRGSESSESSENSETNAQSRPMRRRVSGHISATNPAMRAAAAAAIARSRSASGSIDVGSGAGSADAGSAASAVTDGQRQARCNMYPNHTFFYARQPHETYACQELKRTVPGGADVIDGFCCKRRPSCVI